MRPVAHALRYRAFRLKRARLDMLRVIVLSGPVGRKHLFDA
jgi:hypothetical protein